jgi:hypothetical protein
VKRLAAAALVTPALAGVLACALVALRQPASGGDYAAIWGLKARALARSGSLSAVVRVDPTSLASHPEYPPLWPVLLALFSSPAGRYDDLVVTLLWPLLCAASALLCFRATRAATPWRALAASVVALLPFWRVPLTVGYADALLVVLLLAALVSVDTPREGPALFGLFFLAALTKQEGTLAALVAVLLVAVSRRTRSAALGLAGALLGAVPWALWVSAKLPSPPTGRSSASATAPCRFRRSPSGASARRFPRRSFSWGRRRSRGRRRRCSPRPFPASTRRGFPARR